MSAFSPGRCARLLQIDLLRQWRKIGISTLALSGISLFIYIANAEGPASQRPELYVWMFPLLLIGGGLLFTSMAFSDLHDPLQRFHYLTLPCSNFERFLSRYVLTAPLFYAYALVVYALFDVFAAWISMAVRGGMAQAFEPFESRMLTVTVVYFGVHALMFWGAIFFRSHAAVKTVASLTLLVAAIAAVQVAAFRILYWKYFQSLFVPLESGIPSFTLEFPSRVVAAIALTLSLWVLYIAYQCLRDHEVQGEL